MTARAVLSSAVALAAFFAAGLALVDLVPGLRLRRRPLRAALSYLLGVAWVCGGAYAASHFLHLTVGRGLWMSLALLPIVAAAAARFVRKAAPQPRPRLPRDPFVIALSAVAVLVTAALLLEALSNPIRDWDGRMTWGAQARYLAAQRSVDLEVLRDARYWVAHPHYPLLMPIAQVVAIEALDSGDERVVRPVYAAFWPVLVLLAYGFLRRRVGARLAALAALLVASLAFPAFFDNGGASGAMSDLPLACFWGGGILLLLEARSVSVGASAGLLLAAGALTKNEGLPLAAIALGAGALAALTRAAHGRARLPRRLAPIAAAAFPIALAGVLLVSWRSRIPNRWDEMYPAFPNLEVLRRTAARLPEMLAPAARLTFERDAWGVFWIVSPLVVLLGVRALRRPDARTAALALAATCAFYVVAYGASPWPTGEIVRTTWDRFLLQMILPWMLLVGLALDESFRSGAERAPRSVGSEA